MVSLARDWFTESLPNGQPKASDALFDPGPTEVCSISPPVLYVDPGISNDARHFKSMIISSVCEGCKQSDAPFSYYPKNSFHLRR